MSRNPERAATTVARRAAAPPAPADPEHGLIARLRAGDEAAFEAMIRDYGGRLLAVARRILGNETDAQDAFQDAMLSAFKSLETFEESSRLSTWLHRITVNACLMKLRSRRRRPERSLDGLLPEFLADGHQRKPARPWNPSPSAGIESDEVRALVRAKIAELPEKYRIVLLLRDIEELDTEETGAVLSLTIAAVKTRLHRARQALRELLDPHFVEIAS